MSGNRRDRMARVIREEASRVVLYELADPRIGFVTVTKVKVSADLQNVRIYVSVLGDAADRTKTMAALSRASGVVRHAVAPHLKTRLIPAITFEFDESVEGAFRVENLIREARATDANPDEAETAGTEEDEGRTESEGPCGTRDDEAPAAGGAEETP